MSRLGLNVDHVATLREARGAKEPDPVTAAAIAELAGASCITVHLRQDRRHIQERDVELLRRVVQTRLNLEMAASEAMVELAVALRPSQVTLVPENPDELTTEGGLDLTGSTDDLAGAIERLRGAGVEVSLFIDPEERQVREAAKLGAALVEMHTGKYSEAEQEAEAARELERLRAAAELAHELGLGVAAGHGLNYRNVRPVARLDYVEELQIGHSIISRAVFVGLERAVREMLELIS